MTVIGLVAPLRNRYSALCNKRCKRWKTQTLLIRQRRLIPASIKGALTTVAAYATTVIWVAESIDRFYMNYEKNVRDNLHRECKMYDSDVGPAEDFMYLLYDVFVVGDETSVEDVVLILGTLVAFVAFILWCCFPVTPYYKYLENEDEKGYHVFKVYQKKLIGRRKIENKLWYDDDADKQIF